MSESKFSYYQFQKELGYEIYLRFEDSKFESEFLETLEIMGFQSVKREDILNLTFKNTTTRILKIVKATAKVARQIDRTDFAFDQFGPESFSQLDGYDVYRYRNIGMMILGDRTSLWEVGIKSTRNQDAIRTILTRFLSFSMAPLGVVGFWGVPIEEGFVVMNPVSAKYECVFVDLSKNILITYDGVKDLAADLQILRLDATLKNEMKLMRKEQLLSFLSMNTSHLSYTGNELAIRNTIYELSQIAFGYTYPMANFKPRLNIAEA